LSIDCSYARISIKDTGVGISSEAQKRLFEPFFTTKSKEDGAGLGLSIVYSIMKRHSGSVEISSTEGRGTVVSLYLPLLAPRGAKAVEEAERPPTRGEGLLLVVDDENAVRISAEGMLKLCGYSVLTVDSGQAGIDVYKERGKDIALVLLDVAMPGKSGIDAMREIRAIDPAAKIVMMSGFVENEGINQAIGEGALAFLRKPFTMRYLSKMVKSVLDAPNAGA
jgi:CheY-like chemotaxis protein